jgi:Ion channel
VTLDPNGAGPAEPDAPAWRFVPLLVAQVLLLLMVPLFEDLAARILLDLVLTVLLGSAVSAVVGRRRMMWLVCGLAVPAILLSWIGYATPLPGALVGLRLASATVFLAFTTCCVLWLVFNQRQVTGDTLLGAVSAYMLFGVTWGMLFAFLEHVRPGSIGPQSSGYDQADLLYFSFVTLTTVGYGDMSPATRLARSLVVMEALVGQLYLAILVGRLVGLHLAAPQPAGESES